MEVLDHEPWSWFLLRDGERLLLDVHVSQGPVSASLLLALDDDERAAYEHQGRAALVALAARVQDSAPIAADTSSPYRPRDLTAALGAEVTAAAREWSDRARRADDRPAHRPVLHEPRPGPRPTTSDDGPHRQLDQRAPAAVWGALVARVYALPDVLEGHSQVSPASSRAVFLTDRRDELSPETNLAPGQRLEPVHLHGVEDTSVHLVLPTARAAELVRLGWAEPHQYGDFGTEVMVYAPRDLREVDLVVAVVEESLAFARTGAPPAT